MGRAKPSIVGNLAVSPVPLTDRQHAATYAAALTGELAGLVRRHRLNTLAYILDLARLEAEEMVQQSARELAHAEESDQSSIPSGEREQAAGVPFDPPGELKLEQHRAHKRGR